MKKQGFTLIELMVVIVIMGILAAVAVPKLFGMIAKSKASEVGPAAGEYIKLQDAYVSETGNYVGNWGAIGYSMQQTTSFAYAEGTGVTYANNSAAIPSSDASMWKATSNVALNDCKQGSQWTLFGKRNANGNGMDWKAGIGDAAAATVDVYANGCILLTPQFSKFRTN